MDLETAEASPGDTCSAEPQLATTNCPWTLQELKPSEEGTGNLAPPGSTAWISWLSLTLVLATQKHGGEQRQEG